MPTKTKKPITDSPDGNYVFLVANDKIGSVYGMDREGIITKMGQVRNGRLQYLEEIWTTDSGEKELIGQLYDFFSADKKVSGYTCFKCYS